MAALALSTCLLDMLPRPANAQDGAIAPFTAGPVPKSTDGAAIDTALVVAVDVSQSVDLARYQLQMEGIARALEDAEVQAAIASAPTRSILFALIAWADFPRLVVPWTIIDGPVEARRTAAAIRELPHETGEFTCIARLMQTLSDRLIPEMPITAKRIVVDISGDGADNCSPPEHLDEERQRLVGPRVTVNANPIVVAGDNDVEVVKGAYRQPGYGLRHMPWPTGNEKTPIDAWYDKFVRGGPASFTLPAYGYGDFARAIQRKFVMEISRRPIPDSRQFRQAGRYRHAALSR
ncbi:MAG: DUF1194 domain-containing protein [Hyphomicrobiaceae bacterium]|nr:DUF1194 domain-containing protein [Hyphomicrobiaceae bacterium]